MFLKNIKCLLLYILLIIGSSSFQCSEPINEALQVVELILPISFVPEFSTISLGDSFEISSNVPDTLQDYLTGQYFKALDIDFGTRIMVRKLISNQRVEYEQPAAMGSFQFTNFVGGVENIASSAADFKLKYEKERYKVKVKVTPLETGVYMMAFFRVNSILKNLIRDPKTGQLKDASMNFMLYAINKGNINFDLYKDNCKVPAALGSERDFNIRFGTFTFEVK